MYIAGLSRKSCIACPLFGFQIQLWSYTGHSRPSLLRALESRTAHPIGRQARVKLLLPDATKRCCCKFHVIINCFMELYIAGSKCWPLQTTCSAHYFQLITKNRKGLCPSWHTGLTLYLCITLIVKRAGPSGGVGLVSTSDSHHILGRPSATTAHICIAGSLQHTRSAHYATVRLIGSGTSNLQPRWQRGHSPDERRHQHCRGRAGRFSCCKSAGQPGDCRDSRTASPS